VSPGAGLTLRPLMWPSARGADLARWKEESWLSLSFCSAFMVISLSRLAIIVVSYQYGRLDKVMIYIVSSAGRSF